MKKDDYMDLDFSDIEAYFPLHRREFIKLFGGGIVILVSLRDAEGLPGTPRRL
jgi:hypothetical protein